MKYKEQRMMGKNINKKIEKNDAKITEIKDKIV